MNDLAVVDLGTEANASQDQATRVQTGLRTSIFYSYLQDCRWQPPWRNMADKCADYYDGNQLDQETLDALDRKGMGPLIRNITGPLVNVVLGMEAKTRTDWRVSADTDALQDVAEAMSAKLHEAERETRADRAVSDGYAGQIKAGLHWVEVSRNADPFAYPYRVEPVHRREIWWDWRDQSADLGKARFLIRKRWFDVDQAVAYFPEHEELLRACVGDPLRYDLITNKRALDLGMSLEEVRGLDIEDMEEWRSFDRKRLCLYEVWYRTFVRGFVTKMPNGAVVECNPNNPVHKALLSLGKIKPERAVYSKLRMSMWAGPNKLLDCDSPKRYFPYVPFWGYREDRTGVPYGLIRAMISPQDEVNARLQKMMWLLGAKRVEMDSDALDLNFQSPSDMLAELARPDAVVFMNPQRANRQNAFNVNDNLTLADAQFKVLQDAMMASQQVVGIYNATMGRESGTTANSAIQSLVDQSTTALAEINDNYRYSKRLVGERLLDHQRDDMIGQEVEVIAGEPGRRRKIVLNKRVQVQPQQRQLAQQQQQPQQPPTVMVNGVEAAPSDNPIGNPDAAEQVAASYQMKNDISAAKLKVALDDVPSSAAYREQQFTMLAELTKGLPPNLQAVITPFVIEASDLKKRRDIADTIRKAMGVPTPRTPEEEQQAEQQQAEAMQFAQQIQRKDALLGLQEREAKVMKLKAEGQKALADAARNPNADGEAKAAFEQRVADIQQKCTDQVDKLTADLMTVRMNASTREAKLVGELQSCVAQLDANKQDKNAEIRKAEIGKEIAEIEERKEVEVARINAEAAKTVDGMTAEIAKVRSELATGLDRSKKDAERAAKAAAGEAEKKLREEAKAAEDKRKAEEKAEREKEKAEDKARKETEAKAKTSEKPAAAAPALNLTVAVENGGESTVEIVKTAKGYTATKKSTKPKK